MAESDAADKAVAAAPAPASVSEPLVGERCRCCMAPGPAAKDLSSQYDFMGEKEVYADMLLESFDIRLEKIQSAGWTICEVCIGRLRDSSNFKKQVLYSERCLLQSVGQLPSSGDQKISGDSKMKMVKCESMSDDNDASFLDDDYFDLETDIKEVSVKFEPQPSTSELSNDEDIPLSKMTSTKKKVTTRSSMPMLTISPLKRSSVQKTPAKKTITLKSGVKITSTSGKLTPGKLNLQSSASMKKGMGAVSKMLATASKLGQSPGTKMVLKPGQTKLTLGSTTLKRATVPKAGTKVMVKPGAKLAAAAEKGKMQLAIAVVTQSNAVPFSVYRNKFLRCIFGCYEVLDESTLRDHNLSKHKLNLARMLKAIPEPVLRLDVSNLQCNACSQRIPDLATLEQHLVVQHKLNISPHRAATLMPYDLSTMTCALCNDKFTRLLDLDDHMDQHFPSHICESCGRGFPELKKLNKHNLMHAEKKFVCPECNAPFVSQYECRRHRSYIHLGIGLLVCRICPGNVRFKSHTAKLDHMSEVHGAEKRPTPLCPVCGKTFTTKPSLRKHIHMQHEGGRGKHECRECDESFVKPSDLQSHLRTKHTGAKIPCAYCSKSYWDTKDLQRHLKVQHPQRERRCPCSCCGEICVNRYKLKLHMMEKHEDVK